MTPLSMPTRGSHSPIRGTTPVPNFLLDRVMPRLRDTEWRLLCVIVRQTSGWILKDGTRKQADWMSHFQLRRKTGRSSAAVSRAIALLVRAKLIIVRDSFGQPLMTAAERRRSHSRLSFSLNPDIESLAFHKRFAYRRFQNSKRKNNKNNLDKRKQQQENGREVPEGELDLSRLGKSAS